jgi:outer membrane protein TolC
MANQLPQITLAATGGSAATQFSQLFTSGTGFWSVAAALAQPVFDGGTLLHRKRAADAALDVAVAQYRSTVIAAFQDVADVLEALREDANALEASVAAEHSAATGVEIVRQAERVGSVSYLSTLNAQQAYLQTRLAVSQAQAARFIDTASLFQALGGGWWNRDEDAANAPKNHGQPSSAGSGRAQNGTVNQATTQLE